MSLCGHQGACQWASQSICLRAGVSPGLEGGHEASPTTLTVTLQKELCMGVPSEPIGGQAWGSNRQDTPLPAASPRPSLYTSEDLWDLNRHVGRPGRKPRPRGNEKHTPHGHVVCVRDGGGVGWPLLTGKQHEQGTGSKVPSHVQGN